jgi:membrane AbrB-like protein
VTVAAGSPGSPSPAAKPPGSSPFSRTRLLLMAQTLAIGGCGGAVFAYLGTPLPWMLGALFATMVASMSGLTLFIPQMFRRVWIIVLGVTLGSSFRPEVLEHLHLWITSFAGMCLFVLFGTWLSFQIFVRLGRIDRVTAFFCASPGGLGEMIILGPALGGNERTIVLIHATRVVMVMAIIPPAYSILAGYVPPANLGGSGFFWHLPARELGILAVTGAVGAIVAKFLKVPAWQMIGPMIASGIIHITGVTTSRPPSDFIAVAQLVMGAGAGSRFSGVRVHELVRPMMISGMATICLLASAAVAALALASATGLDFRAIHLAYSPGGFAEMSLIALSLGIEVPFVSLHHLGRMIIVVTSATFVARWMKRRQMKGGSTL